MLILRDFFLLGLAGLGMEVVFTWFFAAKRNQTNVVHHRMAMGYSHPYFIITYGTVALLFAWQGSAIFEWHWIGRYFFFTAYAFVLEALQNLCLRLIHGQGPCEEVYRRSGKALFGGLVRWDFPFYFGGAGFLFQLAYQSMH
ncbi:MAG: hypothetical protein PHS53_04040 [Candidatus Pacebacteria bacterium]|nr:hypothetical protein [Candidatus Paceibacterota bacterium]MDD5357289.1 hypothetical protein [Candidatus Paceibacterota bacterium]